MRAPVYRQLGQGTQFLGLKFPEEFVPVVLLLWGAMALPCDLLLSVPIWLAATLAYRAIARRVPEGFISKRLAYLYRALTSGGFLSAVARATQPRFPHGTRRRLVGSPAGSSRSGVRHG